MRKSTRFLALFLAILTLVGMMPFALLAEDNGSGETTTEPTYANRAEAIAAYATANGGKLFFGHDFNGLDFDYSMLGETNQAVTGQGGGSNLTLAPKNDRFAAVDGAVMLECTQKDDWVDAATSGNSDPLAQFGMSQADTKGRNIVIEISYKGHEYGISNNTPLLITREDLTSGRYTYTLIKTNGDHYVTGVSGLDLGVISKTEFTDFTIVFKSAANSVLYYVNGELKATDKIINNPDYSKLKQGTISIMMTRPVQFINQNANEGIYFDDFYVYSADTPYGWEENKGFIDTVIDSLENTANRLLMAIDFGADTYYKGNSTDSAEKVVAAV